ncbi:MAG: alpha/beta fold hydrolase [Deltaproteobacteria bacterium]|nr:alpha/beta fold hydrolase [Deltaproteobacteria bacterium]
MNRIALIVWMLLSILAWPLQGNAQELNLKPEYTIFRNFQFASGETLPEIKIEYATFGRAVKDAQGSIVNAVVLCHGYSGNYAQAKLMTDIIGPGKPFDTEKYFFICPTALGSPGSSCPSLSGMGSKFPQYTFSDIVKAQYMLVTEHFGIRHLRGVAGASLGGFQALQWIIQYPNFMDWAIPIATSAVFKGRVAGIFAAASHMIRSDPAWQGGHYTEQPRMGMESASLSLYFWYFTAAHFKAVITGPEALLEELRRAGIRTGAADANDSLWRNDAMALFDVSGELHAVKARTLVIGVSSDELFPPAEDLIPLAGAIPGAERFVYDSTLGHMGSVLEIRKAGQAIAEFLKRHAKGSDHR